MNKVLCFIVTVMMLISISTYADTMAYWRFEDGVAGENVVHTGNDGAWYPDILDVSGNENHLAVWTTNNQYGYRSVVGFPIVPLTGQANNLSVKNTGGNPAMWCNTLQDWAPAKWTIEVTFKLENGGYRCIIGRDSHGSATQGTDTNADLAALYLQAIPNNGLAIKFCDVDGYWHDAISDIDAIVTYDYGSDPTGEFATWYSAAAVSDGEFLKLYLYDHSAPELGYQLIATDDLLNDNPGSTNTALTTGAGDGGDWDAGDFTVGRGLYGGGHTDRAWGYMDEIRITDGALEPQHFLMGSSPYNSSVELTADTVNGDVDVTLSWLAARDPNTDSGYTVDPNIVDQYIFIGSDSTLYYIGNLGDPMDTPEYSIDLDLDYDTEYEWVVVEAMPGYEATLTENVSTLDEVDPNNLIGPVWSFASLFSVPTVITDPVGSTAAVGGSATYSVTVDSLSAPSYAWYLSEDDATDTPADDTPVGTDSNTVTLSGLSIGDQGFVYCVVSNESASTDTSATAFLEIEQLIASYSFENDLVDFEHDYDGTKINSDPNLSLTFVAGKTGQAVSFNGTDEAVEIPRSIQNSMTIAFWVNTTMTGNTGSGWYDGSGLVDGEVAGFNADDFGTTLHGNVFCFGVGDLSGDGATAYSTTAVNDDLWHWCVATRDAVTGQLAVYVDGEQEATVTAPLGTKNSPEVLRIGSLQTNSKFFEGAVDLR